MNDSVYVHIPFCASKCGYCAFYSGVYDSEAHDLYTDALINQINHTQKRPESTVKSVFFGGGTPSVIGEKRLYRIIEAIDKKFNIAAAERTCELNPDSVGEILSARFFSYCFNRFSMGVQSFDNGELKLLSRRHNSEQAKKAFFLLREYGAANINLDIMLSLPNANHAECLENTLKTVTELSPEHISAYILTLEQGTPFYSEYTQDGDRAADFYLYACSFFEKLDYEHYEISNFAKKGRRCDHNMGYWTQRPYYAFGSQACGFDGKNRFRNDCTVKDFIFTNGIITPSIEETLDEQALKKEKTMLSLRLKNGTDSSVFCGNRAFIERLIKEGLAVLNKKGGISLTDRGFAVSNSIIAELV